MASNPNQPRTAFHRRLMTMSNNAARGFEALEQRLQSDLQTMNSQLVELTGAVGKISGTPGVVVQILQINVVAVLGDTPWEGISVTAGAPLSQAVALMHKRDVGTLLLTERQRVVGMVTRSQIMAAVLDNRLETPLKGCMIKRDAFHCIGRDDSVGSALKLFRRHRVKRLFVTDPRGAVVGILTLGLLIRWLADRLLAHDTSAA